MSALKLKPKFSIEIGGLGDDLTSYFSRGYFLCADTLTAEGDSLEQLIDNAMVSTQDQDGGEGPTIRLTDLSDRQIQYYTLMILDEMEAQ